MIYLGNISFVQKKKNFWTVNDRLTDIVVNTVKRDEFEIPIFIDKLSFILVFTLFFCYIRSLNRFFFLISMEKKLSTLPQYHDLIRSEIPALIFQQRKKV